MDGRTQFSAMSNGTHHQSQPQFSAMSNGSHHQSQPQEPPPAPSLPSSAVQRRIVWSVERHRRFVEIVSNLDIETALPETIFEQMGDDGVTLEAVASYLRKFNLYLNRLRDIRAEQRRQLVFLLQN